MKGLQAQFRKFLLKFIKPMGTSRGILDERETWILGLTAETGTLGLGECAPLPGLSIDARAGFTTRLKEICEAINRGEDPEDFELSDWPAIQFGLEAAMLDLKAGGSGVLFRTRFTEGRKPIPINGLVTMGDASTMYRQAVEKIERGFDCIKVKVGALDFEAECELLADIRANNPPERVQIRLDANGAFDVDDALEKLERLAQFRIHSLEQPIKPGQWPAMAELCRKSPIPIALDEELIGVRTLQEKRELLQTIAPQFLILKPTLLGGLRACEEWISLARELGVGYWVTSALESNIGLNVIAQWTSSLPTDRHQGLGTGQLFAANFQAPLEVVQGHLVFLPDRLCRPFRNLSNLQLVELP